MIKATLYNYLRPFSLEYRRDDTIENQPHLYVNWHSPNDCDRSMIYKQKVTREKVKILKERDFLFTPLYVIVQWVHQGRYIVDLCMM